MAASAPSTLLPLKTASATLELVGGKGRSLAKLATAGLPVPDGFFLTTAAYKAVVDENNLQQSILRLVAETSPQRPASLEDASSGIRRMFEDARLPGDLPNSIGEAYAVLGSPAPAVAVRSSATAEDLPELSFAGQQDSFLNVRGDSALMDAIRRCWASLWTARAIAYRSRMDIDQRLVAMGVVIQIMAPADISGILFTANPTTGERGEVVVNASFGLGESIVGGEVTPDSFVVDRTSLELTSTSIGAKQAMVVPDEQGTTTRLVPESERTISSMREEQLVELVKLSLTVERLFDGTPQDIEWAIADGCCWLLQSRPITNLPPQPLQDVVWEPPAKGAKLIRRQVVENMPEPLSPLFEELYLGIGLERAADEMMSYFQLPFGVEEFMERPMFLTVNGFAYCRASYRSAWRIMRVMPSILYVYVRVIPRLLKTLITDWREEHLPAYLEKIERWKSVAPADATDRQLLDGVRALAEADASYWFRVAIVLGAAKVTDGLLNRYVTSMLIPGDLTSGLFLRGFPSKTIEAQEALEVIASRTRTDEPLRQLVLDSPATQLLETLSRQTQGEEMLQEIREYLQRYGHQIYNLDFVQPTQIEDPLPVLLGLKALVANDGYDTVARQTELVQERDNRIEMTARSVGPVRRWFFRKFLGWAQHYGPHREEALFYMGAAWPTLRSLALELGTRLTQVGTLDSTEDVFYLDCAELAEACGAREAGRARVDLQQEATRRRELREARKRLHPPGMVPEKSKFKIGPFNFSAFETQKRNLNDASTLNGFAVSPGKVTGPASVILSPADFEQMEPDSILVCPTTTPAWTPLFAQALGLVTDIGGVLAHGSIVAREYGIPAVMGTGNITRRVVSGQRITVDGDAGTVTILE